MMQRPFSFEDLLDGGLAFLGGGEFGVAAFLAGGDGGFLAGDPVTEVGVNQLLQRTPVQMVSLEFREGSKSTWETT